MTNASAARTALPDTPPKLPIRIAWQVAVGSIRVRLSRSMVTVSSIVLAVAFLTSVLGESIATKASFIHWENNTRPVRQLEALRRDLNSARSQRDLLGLWAADPEGIASWLRDKDLQLAQAPSLPLAAALLDWIDSLDDTGRYKILRAETDSVIWLRDLAQHKENLLAQANAMAGVDFALNAADIKAIVVDLPSLTQGLDALATAEQQRLVRIQKAGGAQAIIDHIRNDTLPGGSLLDASQGPVAMAQAGIYLSQTMGPTQAEWDAQRDAQQLRALIAIQHVEKKAQSLLAQFNRGRKGKEPIELADALRGEFPDQETEEKVTTLFASQISQEHGLVNGLRSYVPTRVHQEELRRVFAGLGYDPRAGSQQTFWLVVLSLLVCIVGIVNSMMMAVTERFREIATMKCLGAMDSFIVKSMLLESGGIGIAGSIVGGFLGAILAIIQSWLAYGGTFWSAAPFGTMALAMAFAVVCGLVLTILGALAPAIIAARMHPMDAMRLEA
jgi:ABC-type antimicrobial peptide transport system permease subunit